MRKLREREREILSSLFLFIYIDTWNSNPAPIPNKNHVSKHNYHKNEIQITHNLWTFTTDQDKKWHAYFTKKSASIKHASSFKIQI